jgi:hypothetical protein
MDATRYSIGWTQSRRLQAMVVSDLEKDALERLERFEGTEEDVRCCAHIYERASQAEEAKALLNILQP